MTAKEFTDKTGLVLDTPEKYAHMQLMYASTGLGDDLFCEAWVQHQKDWADKKRKISSISGHKTELAALSRFIDNEIDRPSAGFLKLAALQK